MPESRKIMQSTYLDFLFRIQFFYRLVTKILQASNEIQQTGHSLKSSKAECCSPFVMSVMTVDLKLKKWGHEG
jgi:hypothetical protein